jgi:hypothetical protein
LRAKGFARADPTRGGNCGTGYFGFGHANEPWARRDILIDSEKDCAGCKETTFWEWKESYNVPLFKNSDKRNFSSYRRIPKLFEKLVCGVITPIIGPSISNEQHGLLGGSSTVTSLQELSNLT